MNTLVIEIRAETVNVREIQTKNGPRRVADQVAFVEIGEELRKVRVPVNVEAGQTPYPVGRYVLGPTSFSVGRFHDLEINRFELALVPLAEAGAAARSEQKKAG